MHYTVNVGPSLIFNNIVALSDSPTFLQMGIVLRTIDENQVPVISFGSWKIETPGDFAYLQSDQNLTHWERSYFSPLCVCMGEREERKEGWKGWARGRGRKKEIPYFCTQV